MATDQESKDRHFKDLYANPPDFKVLGRLDPDLAAVLKGRELDFDDPASVMQLTKTLLKLDFDLNIELPDDRLCPPLNTLQVANRHNYILWLKYLLDTSSYEKPGRKAVGIDIGTGASCIYPLLGCTQRPWSFVATDIDAKSLEYARENVKRNGLTHRINVLARTQDDPMIPLQDAKLSAADFTMTNPPFYASNDELLESAAQKSRKPFTACTGSETEMVTTGGEVAFVGRILDESLELRERVQWYTCMVGFLSSATKLVERLKKEGIDNYAVTELVQGSKTRRWAVGWSFQAMRPEQSVARGVTSKAGAAKIDLPPATEQQVLKIALPEKIGEFADELRRHIGGLELASWEWDQERLEGIGRAEANVWNRAWRRKRKREMEVEEQEGKEEVKKEPSAIVFGFQVRVRVTKDDLSVGCRWMEGHDAVIFESFQGYIKATVNSISGTAKGIKK
ncbi:unnamed protein product [Clonostachys rhizophaga]|uniref:U6 small nuclear RNA (adenine-(43)-N(6))-methyltransferase n=1 Tax=Clonostachys rhizophaga TaxID=160324 RepID=A0A9N9VL85_9HYPO|nr:unnamed protein product [Clonostachys rhizophaga]